MTDLIDIQVRDSGTPVVARNLNLVASAANTAATNVNLLNKALSLTGSTNPGFQKLASEATAAQRQVAALTTTLNQQAAAATQHSTNVQKANKQLTATAAAQKNVVTQSGATTKAFAGTSKTARELQFALRTLPAQFTDIAVSLAAGQNPLLVLLQQGGQLKDMFGGLRPALQAMGGYIMGLVNPFTIAAAAVISLTVAFYKGAQEMVEFNKAIILTGNYAQVTASQMSGMVSEMEKIKGSTTHSAMEALTAVAATGEFTGQQFDMVALAAERMRAATGTALEDTIDKYREIAKDPVDGLLKLNKAEHFLTQTQLERIDALVREGRHQDAVTEAMKIYSNVVEDRTQRIVENLGWVEQGWKYIKIAATEALDQIYSIGRPETILDITKQQTEVYKMLNDLRAAGITDGRMYEAYEKRALELMEKRKKLQIEMGKNSPQEETVDSKAVTAQREAAKQFAEQGLKYLSLELRMERDIAEMEKLAAAGKIAQTEIDARRLAIQNEYAERAKRIADAEARRAASAAAKAQREQDRQARELERLGNSIARLRGQVNPVEDALRKLAVAESILNEGIAKGLVTKDEAVNIMADYRERLEDALDPLGAMTRAMDEYQLTLRMSNHEARIQEELYARTESLKRRGVQLTDEETAALRRKIAATHEMERIARARDQFEEDGAISQMDKFKEQLAGLQQANLMEGDMAGALGSLLPWADLSGTQEQMAAYVQMHADMYAQIGLLVDANVIKHETAERLKAQADLLYQQQRLKGASQFFGAVATLSSSSNRKLAAIGKAAAVTQATIDGVLAVQKAYTSVPYPYNIPAAVAQGVIAAANVAQIVSTPLPGFRTGGSMTVGGSGGDDSQLVAFRATPGERVTVNTPAQARAQERGGEPTEVNVPVTVVNVDDPQRAIDAMDTAAGRNVVLNHLQSDPASFRRALGMA